VRCGRCGNDNSAGNRFCGMCGAPLMPKTQSAGASAGQGSGAEIIEARGPEVRRPAAPPPQSPPPQALPMQPAARPMPPVSPSGAANSPSEAADRRPVTLSSFEVARDDEPEREPIISGPSFLGLNKPSPRRAGFHADRADGARDHLRSSGNVDYLLDDEEEPKRGWGKLILIVVALALAAGFGYLRWKQQGGFDWLKVLEKKPAATQPAPDAAPNSADNSAPPAASAAPAGASPAPGSATTSPAQSTAATPTENTAAPSPTSSTPSATTPPDNPPQSNPASDSQVPAPSSKASDAGTPPDSASPATDSDSHAQSSDDEQPAAPKAVARKPSATRPLAAKPSPAKPFDTVAEAEHYVYGSGVHQDCDRGLRMLKTSAGQSDAKAMISLGALYSTGTCAPRDLPTAYRWFALALHKQPDNLSLQDNLQKLWSQMTPPERQLAIKLSQ
jgi:hypothetical protein